MPGVAKVLMRFFGKGALINRLDFLGNCEPGYVELALENYTTNLDAEIAILTEHGIKSCEMPSRRIDTYGRDLRFRIVAPAALDIPFFMTYFSVDPKPENFVHPNGVKGIRKVIYATNPDCFPLIKKLCDDERLCLKEGHGIDVEFER